MLPPKNRLTKKKDFDIIFKKGKTLKGDSLIYKALKNGLKEDRFGFVVSKKISNKATQRNKIKRRLRRAVSDELKKYNSVGDKESLDIVIITLPGIEKKSFLEIKEIIDKLLNDRPK